MALDGSPVDAGSYKARVDRISSPCWQPTSDETEFSVIPAGGVMGITGLEGKVYDGTPLGFTEDQIKFVYQDGASAKAHGFWEKLRADGSWQKVSSNLDWSPTDAGTYRVVAKAKPDKNHKLLSAIKEVSIAALPLEWIEGTESSFDKDSQDFLTLVCNGLLRDLTGVYVDGGKLAASSYQAQQGSNLVVRISARALVALDAGAHQVKLAFTSNYDPETFGLKVAVTEASDGSDGDDTPVPDPAPTPASGGNSNFVPVAYALDTGAPGASGGDAVTFGGDDGSAVQNDAANPAHNDNSFVMIACLLGVLVIGVALLAAFISRRKKAVK